MIATQRSKGIWEAEEVKLALKSSRFTPRGELGWPHPSLWQGVLRARNLLYAAGKKLNFEKLNFHPGSENLNRMPVPGAAQPARFSLLLPMRGSSWLRVVLFFGVQLRGKDTWSSSGLCCRLVFPLLIP